MGGGCIDREGAGGAAEGVGWGVGERVERKLDDGVPLSAFHVPPLARSMDGEYFYFLFYRCITGIRASMCYILLLPWHELWFVLYVVIFIMIVSSYLSHASRILHTDEFFLVRDSNFLTHKEDVNEPLLGSWIPLTFTCMISVSHPLSLCSFFFFQSRSSLVGVVLTWWWRYQIP